VDACEVIGVFCDETIRVALFLLHSVF